MPGSFHERARLDQPTARASFYIPPSPSASSTLSQSVRSRSRTSSPAKETRKRPRGGVRNNSSSSTTPRTSRAALSSTSTFSLDAPSPAPLVSTQYVYAGGTPTADRFTREEEGSFDYEKDLRPSRFAHPPMQHSDSYFPCTPGSEVGGKRRRLSPSNNNGWGRAVWQLTGGIAGKAINFCWTMAFNGFHAGPGAGYSMDVGTPLVVPGDPAKLSSRKDVFDDKYEGSCSTPVPGSFPNDEEGYQPRPEVDEQLPTPTTCNDWGGTSALKSNWVMVDAPAMRDAESSPARKRPRPSTANLHAKPSPRATGARPRMHQRNSASFASPRASLNGRASIAQERPQSSGSDQPQHKRSRSSIASPRRESSMSTPRSPDVVKFEKKLHKRSQKQDDSIRRMNEQMQEMMKEAQQALASKIEIVDDNDDEGYGEGVQASSYGSNWS
ncbi:uncharacterized protein HMPREF1541_02053 [Cyphellophora europaea CBS 101466]|uniref:Uncharacterized protein n=1 Tax=Cyphellophora europaea (strain CBS 101466) TaxID=1220924 RepID=W2S2U1_CYPE1|nr:uncharacterized protein HMPREF1541_02053 [Cyphellophora europaea CBS 101466]ETN42895.1 hypothetical protein HMPREF1541_02053 [Cyphellophora europaea CBS 101466]